MSERTKETPAPLNGTSSIKRLRILGQQPVATGKGTNGDWTLYEVRAEKEDGSPCGDDLRTFQVLPRGELISVELKERHDKRFGTTYTIFDKRGGVSTADLVYRIDVLEELVQSLVERVSTLEGGERPAESSFGDSPPF